MSSRSIRFALASAVLLAAPAAASAQFTSFTAHPPRPADTTGARAPLVALTDSARRAQSDSVNRASIANMKAWVDSAAVAHGTSIPTPVDTALTTTTTTATATGDVGLPAPDTATPLPTLLLLGSGSLAAGAGLLLRRRRVP